MDLSSQSTAMMTFTENQHCMGVLSRLADQRKDGHFCDVTLHIQDNIYLAHRCVLASCSAHFENLLRDTNEVMHHMDIKTNHCDIFESMIEYMYTGKIVLNQDNICDLLRVCHMFVVPKLKAHCAEYLERNININNVFFIKETAQKWQLPILAKIAHSFILANIGQVVNQKELQLFEDKKFDSFISDKGFPMTEDLRFHVICNWVAFDLISRYKLFEDLLKHVQFERLNIQSLYNLVQTEKLFASSDWCMFKILQMLEDRNALLPIYRESLRFLQDKIDIQENVEALMEKHEAERKAREIEENEREAAAKALAMAAAEKATELITSSKDPDNETTEEKKKRDASGDPQSDDASASGQYEGVSEDMPGLPCFPGPCEVPKTSSRSKETTGEAWNDLLDEKSEVKTEDQGDELDAGLADESCNNSDAEVLNSVPNSDSLSTSNDSGKRKRKSKPVKLHITKRGRTTRARTDYYKLMEEAGAEEADAQEAELDDIDDIPLIGRMNLRKKRGRPRIVKEKPKKPFGCIQCDQCSFWCTIEAELTEHMENVHMAKVSHTCSICNYTTTWNREHQKHMKTHFPGPPFICDFDGCVFSAERIQGLLYHRMKHTDERPYRCTICKQGFRTKNNLQMHVRCHTGEKPWKCEVCDRGFATKGTLEQHAVTHSKARPFLCDTCGFSTKYQSHLIAHKRIHTGDVFRCQYSGCKYSTPKRSQLACHMRSHMSIRQYVCATCSRAFVEKSHLVRHERIHLEEKPFKCTLCEYGSTRRDKLKEHTDKHHGDGSPPKTPYKPRKPRRPNKGDSHLYDYSGRFSQPCLIEYQVLII